MTRSDDPAADNLARRAASFGRQAAAYATHRPSYPIDAVRWGLDGRTPALVLDLGAGTGKLTEVLLKLPTDVVAVEPDPAMRTQLTAHYPHVPAKAGNAERIPLPDSSVDAVFVGQALHWFDLPRALPEIARVLRAQGVLVALWNSVDERVPWVAGLSGIYPDPASTIASTMARIVRSDPRQVSYRPFREPDWAEFEHRQRRTAESLVATLSTHSQHLVLPVDEQAAIRARILAYLRSRPETARGEFDLPMTTKVLRTTVDV